MDYQDFTIDVRSAEGGRFEARVIDAPLGGNPGSFSLLPVPRGSTGLARALPRLGPGGARETLAESPGPPDGAVALDTAFVETDDTSRGFASFLKILESEREYTGETRDWPQMKISIDLV
jgi:hypothetical protein